MEQRVSVFDGDLPCDRVLSLSILRQRLIVVILSRPLEFEQKCVESGANFTRCSCHLMRDAARQVNGGHWRFLLLIIRIEPAVDQVSMQATPAPMPCSKSGHIFVHRKETAEIDRNLQLAIDTHVNLTLKRTDTANLRHKRDK